MMSDVKNDTDDQIAKLTEQLAKDADLERLQDEVAFKRAKVDQQKYTQQLQEIEQNEKDIALAKTLNFGSMTAAQTAALQSEWEDYIKAAKDKFVFLNDTFRRIVPFFRKNLILIAAHTGKGKSTAAANIAYSILKQKNRTSGKTGRCLIITNEEKAEDFYARVICLLMGWSYTNHDELTQQQIDTIKKTIPFLGNSGRLVVVDNTFGGAHGMTTTIEGIELIFENLIANKEIYDVIIIDYYQNVISSKNNISLDEYKCQAKLAKMLDQYKNIYPAPIILMAQCDPETAHDHRMFKQRVNGRKNITDGTTLAMELTVDYKLQTTMWTIWKSRYTSFIGTSVKTGFESGKYVEYTDAFKQKVMEKNDRAALAEHDATTNKEAGKALKEKMEKPDGSPS
jgi:replicative DNA helicase